MSSYRTCVVITFALLCAMCVCDLTLFVKKVNTHRFKFACIASQNTGKSAITWLPKSLERDVQKPSSFGFNTTLSIPDLKILGDSFTFALPPVLDYRWESFPTIIVKNNVTVINKRVTNIATINISVLHRSNFTIILRNNQTKMKLCATVLQHQNKNTDFVDCDRKELLIDKFNELGYEHWKHFTIYKENNKFHLGRFDVKTDFEKFDIDRMDVVSPSGQIKLHNYTIFVGHPKMKITEDCTCFHVFTAEHCEGLDGKYKEWMEVKLKDEDSDKYEDCLISGVRRCESSENRIMYLETNDTNVACSSLMNENDSINYRVPTGHGNYLKEKPSVVKLNSVVCNEKDCFCAEERTGAFCETGANRVRNLKASGRNRSIAINWNPPNLLKNEIVDYYQIQYIQGNSEPVQQTQNCSSRICEFVLENAIFNVTYNISVSTKIQGVDGFGLPEFGSYKNVAMEPKQVKILSVEPNCTLVLIWTYPEEEWVKGFHIKVSGDSQYYSEYVDNNNKNKRIYYRYEKSNLKTGIYNISIMAENMFGIGDPEIIDALNFIDCETKIAMLNAFYLYIIAASIGLLLLSSIIYISIKKRRKTVYIVETPNNYDETVLLQETTKLLIERKHVNDVLQQWVYNNIYDTHLIQEYTDAHNKNRALQRIIKGDYCRVKVRDPTCATDANAHYIQGCKGFKSYVAIQCPKSYKMNEAFWTIVWDEKISIIVSLLTDLECMQLCCNYWNTNDSNNIKVKLNHVDHYTDFTIKNLTITRCGDSRKILQLNYFSWPNNKVPVNPSSFVSFLKCVKSRDRTNYPILVHSSESFGRTGTYIMCDYFINNAEKQIDVSKYFAEISKCRPCLIKNFQQYKFVYYVIDELNTYVPTSIHTSNLINKLSELMETNVPKHSTYIKRRGYIYKLLYSDENETNSNSDWIEVPGYQCEYTFHVTKYPPNENAHAFWDYIYTNEITQVVILQNMTKERGKFWPSQHEPLILGSLRVTMITCNPDKIMKVYRASVKKDNQNSVDVVILFFKCWEPNKRVPNNLNEFYEFFKTYNNIKNIRDDKTIVCCSDGALGSGVFICLDFLLKKWRKEDVFDLVWAILSIKQRHDRFMDHMDQHKFMYKLFEYFMENEEKCAIYNEYEQISRDYSPEYDLLEPVTP